VPPARHFTLAEQRSHSPLMHAKHDGYVAHADAGADQCRDRIRVRLAQRKREQFVRDHGKLYCEQCGVDPVKIYGAKYGAACIEVHHARVTVAPTKPGHQTQMKDLKCLCANCHRVEPKRVRVATVRTLTTYRQRRAGRDRLGIAANRGR